MRQVSTNTTLNSTKFIDHCASSGAAMSSDQKVQEGVEIPEDVEIQVGSKDTLKIFIIKRTLLFNNSRYFRRKYERRQECEEVPVFIGDFEPMNFEMFLQWTLNPCPSIPYDPDMCQPKEPWLSHAATTWLLGKKLECSDDFDRYALSQVIQNCAFMAFGPWALIEDEVPKGSLRLFSDHWVAWNYWLAGPDPNEYSGLRAAIRSDVPNRDPRTFDIEHWYSECGRYRQPRCLHDPIARLEEIKEASRPKPVPPAEWGRAAELGITKTQLGKSTDKFRAWIQPKPLGGSKAMGNMYASMK